MKTSSLMVAKSAQFTWVNEHFEYPRKQRFSFFFSVDYDTAENTMAKLLIGIGHKLVNTSIDQLLNGKITLKQPEKGYRVSIDAFFLGTTIKATPNQTILDVGTGVGSALLCTAYRHPTCHFTGLEIQPELVNLAQENMQLNSLSDRAKILLGSIQAPPPEINNNSYDHVMSNPPFMAAGHSSPSPETSKALSTHETEVGLREWVEFCIKRTTPKGTVTFIHRADRLDELLSLMHQNLGAITVFPLWPKLGQPAKRIIVQGRKGIKTRMSLHPGLVLHQDDGSYTATADAVLRGDYNSHKSLLTDL